MIRFLFVFAALAGISRWEPFIANFREPYCELLARTLGFAFSIAGLDPSVSGPTIQVGFGTGLMVVPSCDGLVLLFLFISGVTAMPLQRTLPPYLWGGGFITLLIIINWVRLAMLALTGFFKPDLFEVMHIYVIQVVLILAVALLFLAWLSHLDPEDPPAEGGPETYAT
jgi:exosortase/archaeosortase family protein